MCDVFQARTDQEALRDIIGVLDERPNLQSEVKVYSACLAPVIRNGEDPRALVSLNLGYALCQT